MKSFKITILNNHHFSNFFSSSFVQKGLPGPIGPMGPAGPTGEKVNRFLWHFPTEVSNHHALLKLLLLIR